ncbi:MAG: 4Fe-4S dicluster domain-containing protein [Ruminococcaceae bacterium]|nr:4Fe-4S dicluster domain-containing protein [Oscillospiraceae bacterium]
MTFDKVKNRLGFGCMRLKMTDDNRVDYDEFSRMIDAFMGAGFNYFDTAHGYIDGQSETAIRDCLVARYDREDFVLADKLSCWYFEREEDILPLLEHQLSQCGVDYFDFYLFHSVTRNYYEKFKSCNAFEIIKGQKERGKIRHIAMSFHDTAEVLDQILTEQPFIEAVQLQFNYLDYDDPGVQSKACYDVAVKHGKQVMVMEPVRGGYLANLPAQAAQVFDRLDGDSSYASYALRYAAGFPAVRMVLSGMGDMDMMRDNIRTFTEFAPLGPEELAATDRAREIIRQVRQLPCTGCGYCTEVCQKNIPIPELFSVYNQVLSAKISRREAKELLPGEKGLAADCIQCGACEKVCPQSIDIKKNVERISKW